MQFWILNPSRQGVEFIYNNPLNGMRRRSVEIRPFSQIPLSRDGDMTAGDMERVVAQLPEGYLIDFGSALKLKHSQDLVYKEGSKFVADDVLRIQELRDKGFRERAVATRRAIVDNALQTVAKVASIDKSGRTARGIGIEIIDSEGNEPMPRDDAPRESYVVA